MHGNVGESVAFHPLGPITLIAAVVLVLGLHNRFPGLAARLQTRPVLGACASIWVAVWLVRLAIRP